MAIADKKLQHIRTILANGTYSHVSGLYQQAEEALGKLSETALGQIALLVGISRNDARTKALADATTQCGCKHEPSDDIRCGCGEYATHEHDGKPCCRGEMCCPTANE